MDDATPSTPSSFEEAHPLLRLRPLGADPLAIRRTMVVNAGGDPQDADAARPAVADLLVGAYLDLPTADVPVSSRQLSDWQVSLDEVITEAAARTPTPAGEHVGAASYVDDRSVAAAALLNPDLARSVHGSGTPFVLVPTQQHLIVADLDDGASLGAAFQLAVQALQDPNTRLVSRTPLALRSDGWAPVELADEGPVRTLRHHFDNRLYAEATEQVKAAHERLGITDVMVPKYQAGQKPTGETMSITSLTDEPGLRAFLPLTDEVALVRVDGSGVTPVPMERLRSVPELTRPVPGLRPPYLEVNRFPDELCS